MCMVKTPKLNTTTEKPKEPTVIRNPYLDGPSPMNKALRDGRNAFRIERGTKRPQPTPSTTPVPAGPPVVSPSVPFGGGAGRSGGGGRMYITRGADMV